MQLGASATSLLGTPALGVQVGREQPCRLLLGAGHEVAVAVERDRDVRVAHEHRQRLRVHSCGDHQARKRVTAGVRRDPLQPRRGPGLIGASLEHVRRERNVGRVAEDQLGTAAAGSRQVLGQVVAQDDRDRHLAPPGIGLRSIGPSAGSHPRSTRITPVARSTSWTRSARSSPSRNPANIAVAHIARSRSGTLAMSASASSGEA